MRTGLSNQEEWEQEVERIEQGGNAWERTEAVGLQVKRPLDTVVPVRLPSDTWAELRKEAARLGVGPSTLVRMWVLEKLRELEQRRKFA